MKLIAHRGNVRGPNPERENDPEYVKDALIQFDAEVDVWLIGSRWFTGHDAPIYEVRESFLRLTRLWLHAKNIEALTQLTRYGVNCFWHQDDQYTLTAWGYIWAYPGMPLPGHGIQVMTENVHDDDGNFIVDPRLTFSTNCTGVCTDHPELFRQFYPELFK